MVAALALVGPDDVEHHLPANEQESPRQRVLAYVHVDASTLEFRAVLAPVGEVVLIEGNGSTTREVGRFVVPSR